MHTCSAMVIIVGNGHGDQSSNPDTLGKGTYPTIPSRTISTNLGEAKLNSNL